MVAFLRSLLYAVICVLLVIPWAMVVLILSIFMRGPTLYWLCVGYLRATVVLARAICGVQYRVQGLENLPTAASTEPVILVPKHQSTWETLAMPMLMSHPLAYVFKRELLRVPFFGWAMGRLDMIHIDRSNRTESWAKVAAQGQRLLNEGVWVIMFPEGTRTTRGSQGTYKTGAARLAVATGASLVPIAVSSAQCWPRGSFTLHPGVIDVVIGPRLAPQGREADELMREVEQWIETQMRRIDPQAYGATTSHAAPGVA
jgi:1-acyl-sn-glycerol-3-phosphate acyltransferase